MESGWKDFREHYSIDFGHSLVFQFDGERFAVYCVNL